MTGVSASGHRIAETQWLLSAADSIVSEATRLSYLLREIDDRRRTDEGSTDLSVQRFLVRDRGLTANAIS